MLYMSREYESNKRHEDKASERISKQESELVSDLVGEWTTTR